VTVVYHAVGSCGGGSYAQNEAINLCNYEFVTAAGVWLELEANILK
jgi:hypothetical protein